jgi:hypothetical protein
MTALMRNGWAVRSGKEQDVRPGPWNPWEFEEIYYVAKKVFNEKGGKGDVRDYSEREAGLTRLGLPASPSQKTRSVLLGATRSSGSDLGPHRSANAPLFLILGGAGYLVEARWRAPPPCPCLAPHQTVESNSIPPGAGSVSMPTAWILRFGGSISQRSQPRSFTGITNRGSAMFHVERRKGSQFGLRRRCCEPSPPSGQRLDRR